MKRKLSVIFGCVVFCTQSRNIKSGKLRMGKKNSKIAYFPAKMHCVLSVFK